MLNVPARFLSKIAAGENNCWVWTSSRTPKGYGTFHAFGRVVSAHRFIYEQSVGRIPDDLTLDHLCRNRACVNPEHLEPVTMTENVLRGYGPTAVNARKTHCIHGHEFSDANTYLKRSGKQRECRMCKNKRERERYHRKRQSPPPGADGDYPDPEIGLEC